MIGNCHYDPDFSKEDNKQFANWMQELESMKKRLKTGEVFVFYYDYELFDVNQVCEAYDNISAVVAPIPVIALPKGWVLDGMPKKECRDILLDMMERIS